MAFSGIGAAQSNYSIVPATVPRAVLGNSYTQTFSFSPQALVAMLPAAGNIPPGMTYNPLTKTLSGTPTAEGIYVFELSAIVGISWATQRYYLTVARVPLAADVGTTASNGADGVDDTRTGPDGNNGAASFYGFPGDSGFFLEQLFDTAPGGAGAWATNTNHFSANASWSTPYLGGSGGVGGAGGHGPRGGSGGKGGDGDAMGTTAIGGGGAGGNAYYAIQLVGYPTGLTCSYASCGGANGGQGGRGATALLITAGELTNTATVEGGLGGSGGAGGAGGTGGRGGDGGAGGSTVSTAGGLVPGVPGNGGNGSDGGTGGDGGKGGAGGAGVEVRGATLINRGVIYGGAAGVGGIPGDGGAGGAAGAGGASSGPSAPSGSGGQAGVAGLTGSGGAGGLAGNGVDVDGGATLDNRSRITGGSGGVGGVGEAFAADNASATRGIGGAGTTGGAGVFGLGGSTLNNSGVIYGGVGGPGGNGGDSRFQCTGSLLCSVYAGLPGTGGNGGSGGAAIYFGSATAINTGLLIGGTGAAAGAAGSTQSATPLDVAANRAGDGGPGARLGNGASLTSTSSGLFSGGVSGGDGADGLPGVYAMHAGDGGSGLVMTGGTFTATGVDNGGDSAIVAGGKGGAGGGSQFSGGTGGNGGHGILGTGSASITDGGFVKFAGGHAGAGGVAGNGGAGGAGASLSGSAALVTQATSRYLGGNGASGGVTCFTGRSPSQTVPADAGPGGAGLQVAGMTVTHRGRAVGGNGGASVQPGAGDCGGGGAAAPNAAAGGSGIVANGNASVIHAGQATGGFAGGSTSEVDRAPAIALHNGGNTLELNAGYTLTGNVVSDSGSGATGDTLALGGTVSAAFDLSQLGDSAKFRGFAGLRKSGSSTWTVTGDSAFDGPLTVAEGTLEMNGRLTASAVAVNAGTLTGVGQVGAMLNAGIVAPGPASQVGTLTVASFSQMAAGILSSRIYAAGASQLQVNGAATLAGAIRVTLDTTPTIGTRYTLVSATSISGTFSALTFAASLPTNVTARLVYSATKVELVIGGLPATHFKLVPSLTQVPFGAAFSVTVTALDANEQTVTDYAGTVRFGSSDASATLPPDSALNNGAGTFATTLRTVGAQSITATDTVAPTITGAVSIDVIRAAQTITFAQPSAQTWGARPTLSASVSSGLTIMFTASGACTVASSTATTVTLNLTDVGDCTVAAAQPGNTQYLAAPSVSRAFAVNKAEQTIAFTSAVPNPARAGQTYTVSATGGASTQPVVFSTAAAAAICTVNGSIVSFTGVGACSIAATQAGDAHYNAAAGVTQAVTIGKGSQTVAITSSAPTGATYLGAKYRPVATGGASSQPVRLTIDASASAVCAIDGVGDVSFTGVGQCVIDANQAADANYDAATQVQQSFAVGKAEQSIVFAAAPSLLVGQAVTVSASGGNSGNAVVFTSTTPAICTSGSSNGATITAVLAGSCIVAANQAGDGNYKDAPQATLTIVVGAANSKMQITSSPNPSRAGMAVTFSITVAPVFSSAGVAAAAPGSKAGTQINATPTGSVELRDNGTLLATLTLDGNGQASFTTSSLIAGNHTIVASYAGDANNASATATFVQAVEALVVPILSGWLLAALAALLLMTSAWQLRRGGRKIDA